MERKPIEAGRGRLAYMVVPGKLADADYPLPALEPDAILVKTIRANVTVLSCTSGPGGTQ